MKDSGKITQLLKNSIYNYSINHDDLFMSALKEELEFHQENNESYNKFLSKSNFSLNDNVTLQDVPFIPVQVFKVLGDSLKSVEDKEIYTKLSSSATSGVPSTVLIDRITAKRQKIAMSMVLRDYIGENRRPFIVIDLNPLKNTALLGARDAAVRGYLNFSSSFEFFLDVGSDGKLQLDVDSLANYLKRQDPNEPVIVFGFTYVLYEALVTNKFIGKSFGLPSGSKIIHIGGWKKLENIKVSKKVFNSQISSIFNCPSDSVIDIYGFTEQMGLNYPDCDFGWKHVPRFSRVIVRDPNSHIALPATENGLLEFISPVPHSYPGNAILTDDIGYAVDGDCECGRGGQRFKVIGRAKKAEIRGCGDIIGEKYKLGDVSLSINNENINELKVILPESADDLEEVIEIISNRQKWLYKQPLDSLIGIIDKVSKQWLNNEDLNEWSLNGLNFLVRWCSTENLNNLLHKSLRYSTQSLDRFSVVRNEKVHAWRAVPKGIVGHWLSGNVPLLGMLTLVQSILTKNANIIKIASKNNEALPILLNTFKDQEYVTPGGYKISGNDLLQTVGVVHYPSSDIESAIKLSMGVDARIAWGGRDAIEAICSLPSRAGCEDIVFGPKLSCTVIAREAFKTERLLKKTLRKLAIDISSFDQEACSSPHTVFIERNGIINVKEFGKSLGEYLQKTLLTIPKAQEDQATITNIQTARVVGDFIGTCWKSDDYSWTVIYNETLELSKPTYSRVVTVVPVNDINDAVELLHPGIQTVGLAAEGPKKISFAENATEKGVFRFPEIGRMTNFDVPWDGIFVSDRLVSWVSLGGPLL